MSKINLTDISVSKLPLPEKGQKTYFDASTPGFGVRVSQGGTKTFVAVLGKNRTYRAIGRYPAVTLKTARAEAKRLLLAQSSMPLERPALRNSEVTERFLEACTRKNKPRTVYDYRRVINRHFDYGTKSVNAITRSDVVSRLNKLNHTPSEKHHAFVTVRAYFNWCVNEGIIETSPVVSLSPTKMSRPRERILTTDELVKVWNNAVENPGMFETIVRLLILTGLRRSEVSALHRDWFDGEVLTLPDTLTKNRRNCTVPVPSTVLVLVRKYPDQFFENDQGTTFCGWGKAKARFDKRLEGVAPFTLHDLRRTYSSVHAQLGTPIHVVEKLLNHVSGSFSGVAGVYNRYSYMDEMKVAVQRYEDWIKSQVLRQV